MKRKWTLFTVSPGDFKTLERYLNEQAAQGWELERTGILARWKRTQRRDLTYCVDLADPGRSREEQTEYIDLCAEGGWELVGVANNLYIFQSRPGADVIPIQTDRELEKRQYDRYYIRNVILGGLVLAAQLAFWILLNAAMSSDLAAELQEMLRAWPISWTSLGIQGLLLFWSPWAIWKLIDFLRAAVKGRTGSPGESPGWILWLNCVMSLIFCIGAAVFYLCLALDFLFAAERRVYPAVFLVLLGGLLLWRALEVDRERFKGERRRYVTLGVAALLAFVLLLAGRALLPYGTWSTSPWSSDREEAALVYAQTEDLPLVHGEALGLPDAAGEEVSVRIVHEVVPAGECWALHDTYNGLGLADFGSTTLQCRSGTLARAVAGQMACGQGLGRYTPWPTEGLRRVELDWADDAWYGSWETGSILVLRTGRQVTRLVFPVDLLQAEHLAAIRAELKK